jgi:hypothetical protein
LRTHRDYLTLTLVPGTSVFKVLVTM